MGIRIHLLDGVRRIIHSEPLTPKAADQVSVLSSSTLVLNGNDSRTGLVLYNASNHTVSLGLGSPAVLNRGITLAPRGSWTMDRFTFCQSAIYAIASTTGAALAIQEFE